MICHRCARPALSLLFAFAACHSATGTIAPPTPPALAPIAVVANRDSVKLTLPAVAGAADYRAYALPAQVSFDGGVELVTGTTIFCAGLVQHDLAATIPAVLPVIEVNGLTGPTDLVVEAIDRPCPFPGVIAADHHDIDVTNVEVAADAQGTFSIVTEAEVIANYGALIINGQGPATKPGQAAPPDLPRVLASSHVQVVPTGNGAPLTATFFDDFADATDQPAFIKALPDAPPYHASQNGQLWHNKKWSIYSYGAHHEDDGAGNVTQNSFHPYIARGGLQMVLADWQTDIFSSAIAYPRQLVHPSATNYLHVTYEVQSDASERRYWNIFVCGADQPGATMSADGELLGDLIQTPFFFDPDGLDPVAQGWNCFQIFMRGGWPVALPPGNAFPESDVRVMVNLSDAGVRESVVDVSPDQILANYPGQTGIGPASWYRQQSGATLTAPMLDEALTIGVRQRYDLWLRRDRAVLFVDGQQRLCNDFPSVALTMPEAALGFGQVLYHSAAERNEFSVSYWMRTGQRYYLDDAPFVDSRTWDNLGFEENVAAIPQFDATACFTYAP